MSRKRKPKKSHTARDPVDGDATDHEGLGTNDVESESTVDVEVRRAVDAVADVIVAAVLAEQGLEVASPGDSEAPAVDEDEVERGEVDVVVASAVSVAVERLDFRALGFSSPGEATGGEAEAGAGDDGVSRGGPFVEGAHEDGDDDALPGDDTEARPGLEKAPPAAVGSDHLKSVVESLLFVSDRPLPALRIAKIARAQTKDVQLLLDVLAQEYRGRGIELVEVAGGFQFRSAAANAPFVRELVARKPVRLTRAQVETLAITAYRQPITRPEIDEIRGVDSGSALKVLLERLLLKIIGRKDEPGRPLLYGTTPHFLEFFGLSSLRDLPTLREYSELSDESRSLFQRRTGESIEEIADIAVEKHEYSDEELEATGHEAVAAAPDDERGAPDEVDPRQLSFPDSPGTDHGVPVREDDDEDDDEDDEDEDEDDEDDDE